MDDLSSSLLAEVSRAIEEGSGLAFPPEKWRELRKGLETASGALGLSGARDLAERLLSPLTSGKWMAILLDNLTVGETYFFREPETLEALESDLLPELIRERRTGFRALRIWSAGCASGEEPYTLAILLCRMIPDIDLWDISILATDLNMPSLRKAEKGIYTAWSFRGTPEWVKNGFFRHAGEHRLCVVPKVRNLVRFDHLNLGSDVYPTAWSGTKDMDLIFCRNVLMYFSPERAEAVLRGFFESLVPGGHLVVGANELTIGRFEGFERVARGKAFCFRKPSGLPKDSSSITASVRKIPSHRGPAAVSVDPARKPHRRAPVRSGSTASPAASLSPRPPGRAPDAEPLDPLAAARLLADDGRFEEALRHCSALLKADEMNPGAHYLYAVILQETGNAEEAVRELKRVIYLDPEFVPAYVSLAHILRVSGNRREADRQFSNALSILERYQAGDVVPESGGTTAGALAAMIRAIGQSGNVAGDGGGL